MRFMCTRMRAHVHLSIELYRHHARAIINISTSSISSHPPPFPVISEYFLVLPNFLTFTLIFQLQFYLQFYNYNFHIYPIFQNFVYFFMLTLSSHTFHILLCNLSILFVFFYLETFVLSLRVSLSIKVSRFHLSIFSYFLD